MKNVKSTYTTVHIPGSGTTATLIEYEASELCVPSGYDAVNETSYAFPCLKVPGSISIDCSFCLATMKSDNVPLFSLSVIFQTFWML